MSHGFTHSEHFTFKRCSCTLGQNFIFGPYQHHGVPPCYRDHSSITIWNGSIQRISYQNPLSMLNHTVARNIAIRPVPINNLFQSKYHIIMPLHHSISMTFRITHQVVPIHVHSYHRQSAFHIEPFRYHKYYTNISPV